MVQEALTKSNTDEAPESPKAPTPRVGHFEGLIAKFRKEASILRARKAAIAKARAALDAEEVEIETALATLDRMLTA